jgi:RNA-directed DNA polymerase
MSSVGNRGELSIDKTLRRRLDFDEAVKLEAAGGPWSLPSRSVELALRNRIDETTRHLVGQFSKGLDLPETEVIQVSKSSGIRPCHVMTFPERVLYRALSLAVKPFVKDPDRSGRAYEDFKTAPLEVEGTRFVVSADVAAFYQYIDHDLLAEELIGQTGDAQVAEALSSLLADIMGRRFGIPQMNHSSDLLSEIVIDIAERQLIRAGFDVVRFNDDFRISASSAIEANRSIELLEECARRIGLTLNEQKTFIQSVDAYRESVEVTERLWEDITSTIHLDMRQFSWSTINFYEPPLPSLIVDTEADPSQQDHSVDVPDEEARGLWTAIANELITRWIMSTEGDRDWANSHVYRLFLRQGLRIMRGVRSPDGLPYLSSILVKERDSTAQVATYLRTMAPTSAKATQTSIDECLSGNIHISQWQALWLFEGLKALPELSQPQKTFLRLHCLTSSADTVRARAAYVLTLHGEIDADSLFNLYDEVTPAAKSDVIAAIARLLPPGHSRVQALAREDFLARAIVEYAHSGAAP